MPNMRDSALPGFRVGLEDNHPDSESEEMAKFWMRSLYISRRVSRLAGPKPAAGGAFAGLDQGRRSSRSASRLPSIPVTP
jgi:hypothetical protein